MLDHSQTLQQCYCFLILSVSLTGGGALGGKGGGVTGLVGENVEVVVVETTSALFENVLITEQLLSEGIWGFVFFLSNMFVVFF